MSASAAGTLTSLITVSESFGNVLAKADTVVYESMMYLGGTEEVCVPILERVSELQFNGNCYVGYSPERLSPGDKEHRVITTLKVTWGSTPAAADFVDTLYASIITAGTRKASSKVAKAAIENARRDLNISLVSDVATLFNKLGIDTPEVLETTAPSGSSIDATR